MFVNDFHDGMRDLRSELSHGRQEKRQSKCILCVDFVFDSAINVLDTFFIKSNFILTSKLFYLISHEGEDLIMRFNL